MREPFQSREERFKTFVLMRKERWEHYNSLINFRMKYLLAIFSAFFAATGIYYHYMVRTMNCDCHFTFLYLAWFSILIGIGLLFIQFHMTTSWIVKKMEYEDYLYLDEDDRQELSRRCYDLDMKIDIVMWVTDFFFFLALVLFFIFLIMK